LLQLSGDAKMLFRRRRRAERDGLSEATPTVREHGRTTAEPEQTINQDQKLFAASRVYGPLTDEHPSTAASPTEGSLLGLRVLLAEDHEVNADLMIDDLKHMGAKVQHAPDGAVACELFMANAFDVVLMDCQMPVVDGFEASRRIRAWEAQRGQSATPIIAMTGLSHEFEHAHWSQVGMGHYLVKPFGSALMKWTILKAIAALRSGKRS
jgi:CheY-like chemotaxis protein